MFDFKRDRAMRGGCLAMHGRAWLGAATQGFTLSYYFSGPLDQKLCSNMWYYPPLRGVALRGLALRCGAWRCVARRCDAGHGEAGHSNARILSKSIIYGYQTVTKTNHRRGYHHHAET